MLLAVRMPSSLKGVYNMGRRAILNKLWRIVKYIAWLEDLGEIRSHDARCARQLIYKVKFLTT